MIYVLLAISILLFGCSEETIEDEILEDTGSKGVLYEVKHEGNTVFLFGSLHFSTRDLQPLNKKIDEAYNSSDYLVIELDSSKINFSERNKLHRVIGMYTDGTTINENISSETYDQLLQTLTDLGLPETLIKNYRPWLITDSLKYYMLFSKGGASHDLGTDHYFLRKAATDNKEVIQLESIEDQVNIYTHLTADLQEKELRSALLELEETNEKFEELLAVWSDGDLTGISEFRKIEVEDANPNDVRAYFNAIFIERDRKMTEKIEDFLINGQGKTYFVVVGAFHLVGEESITDLLKTKGYEVKNVFE